MSLTMVERSQREMLERSTAALQVAVTLLLTSGCATTRPHSEAHRLAVLPTIWLTPSPQPEPPLQGTVAAVLTSQGHAVDIVSNPIDESCGEDIACATAPVAASGADKIFVIRVAQLGSTTVMRLQTVDGSGAVEQSAQIAVEQSDTVHLIESITTLTNRLESAYRPATPWYRRPVVFAVAAAGVVAGVAVVVLTSGGDAKPDLTVRPP